MISTSKTSFSSAALAASERSGEAVNAAGAPAPDPRPSVPDSEVIARPHRRRFSAEYKLSIIEQADSAHDAGAIGLLLRREGLYSSHLSNWRQQRKQGEFDALMAKKRGPKVVVSPLVKQGIVAGDLTIHADRGTSMTSKPVALMLADLGVTKTHSRPHVSDDNPYSEIHSSAN